MKKKTVYNKKTGEKFEVEPVDYKEFMATGGYSDHPIDAEEEKPKKKAKKQVDTGIV